MNNFLRDQQQHIPFHRLLQSPSEFGPKLRISATLLNGRTVVAIVKPTVAGDDREFPKYCVDVGSTQPILIGLSDPLLALQLAVLVAKKRSILELDNVVLIRRKNDAAFTAEADAEYNAIIGAALPDAECYIEPTAFKGHQDCDEDLYQEFKRTVNANISAAPSCRCGGTPYDHHMGPSPSGTEVITPSNSYLWVTRYRKAFTPRQHLEATRGVVPRFCVPIAKFYDGKVRLIYSMPVPVEALQRCLFKGACYQHLPGYVKIPFLHLKGERHSYDIVGCDRQVAPYFMRYVEEVFPEYVDQLYPYSLLSRDRMVRPDTMPSGAVFTAFITNCFTYSLCKYMGVRDFQFQGDGFVTSEQGLEEFAPVALRVAPDYSLNNFRRGEYIAPHKLLVPQYKRRRGVSGKLRYFLRYYALMHMNADLKQAPLPPKVLGLSIDSDFREVAQKVKDFLDETPSVFKAFYEIQKEIEGEYTEPYSERAAAEVFPPTQYSQRTIPVQSRFVSLVTLPQ